MIILAKISENTLGTFNEREDAFIQRLTQIFPICPLNRPSLGYDPRTISYVILVDYFQPKLHSKFVNPTVGTVVSKRKILKFAFTKLFQLP